MNPTLSILIPYYHDDPSELLTALLIQGQKNVEILLYDDGTADEQINAKLSQIAAPFPERVKLLFAKENKGRSFARNALFDTANAPWVLFLDADMMPESALFIETYLSAIARDTADVLFGGFAMDSHFTPDTALHHAFSKSSDALSAAERRLKGPQYVCSSNLCVRASVLREQPFDTAFIGWGWEDSEWAARIAKSYRLEHIENAALHLGLESTETLLSRFKTSAANYEIFTQRHPELAKSLTLFKMRQRLRNIPGHFILRPILAAIVRANRAPMKMRLLAIKLWRASWYARPEKLEKT